jgi:hypothetical protein
MLCTSYGTKIPVPETMSDVELYLDDDDLNALLEPSMEEIFALLATGGETVSAAAGKRTWDAMAATSQKRPLRGPSRRHKKPKGMPKRPLTAYNLFFKSERSKIVDSQRVGFEELGRIIGARWRAYPTSERAVFEENAQKDVIRYRKEMDSYEDSRSMTRKKKSETLATSIAHVPDFDPSNSYSGPSFKENTYNESSYEEPAFKEPNLVTPLTPALRSVYLPPRGANCLPEPPPLRTTFPHSPPVRGSLPQAAPVCHQHLGDNDTAKTSGPLSTTAHPMTFSPQASPLTTFQRPGYGRQSSTSPVPILSYRGPPQMHPADRGPVNIPTLGYAIYERGRLAAQNQQQHWPVSARQNQPISIVNTGVEVLLPDELGHERKYMLRYECYQMTRAEADAYMERQQVGDGWSPRGQLGVRQV